MNEPTNNSLSINNNFCLSLSYPAQVMRFYEEWKLPGESIAAKTSGSTGEPKEIRISKQAMCASARQTISFFDLKPQQNLLLCLPVDFIAGKMMVVRSILANAMLVLSEPASNPLIPFLTSKKIHLDFAAFTPQQVAEIISEQGTRDVFRSIKKVIIGGGEIPTALEKNLTSYPNEIYATYGMTETITHIAVRKTGNPVYKVFKGVNIGIDSRSCLTVQADYLGPEKIITNDVVEAEGPHEFRFLGRFDNVINSGGIKLHPEKIEKKLEGLFTQAFYIHHKPDEVLGQHAVLVVECEPFDSTTIGLLQNTLKETLDKFEMPREIIFKPVFERTATGKIIRKA
jgi:O-succinylbenzoic acid--CoA ligase